MPPTVVARSSIRQWSGGAAESNTNSANVISHSFLIGPVMQPGPWPNGARFTELMSSAVYIGIYELVPRIR